MAAIVYRRLNAGDYVRFAQINGQAFNTTPPSALTPEQWARWRGLFIGGELVAQLETLPLWVQTGAGTVGCLGLGGVASPPEQRRRGYVATLLRTVCDEARAAGTSLCLLHPFKESFYHRFGWATALERRAYSCAPALLRSFREGGGAFVRVDIKAIDELNAIYTEALRGRWGPLVRDKSDWERIIVGRQHQRYSYIWRDAKGKSRALIIYSLDETPAGLQMACRELVALDPQARSQLFAFLANHDSQCVEVRFSAPTDAPVNLLMPDPLRCEIEPWGMLRLLDIPGALAGYPAPKDMTGRCVLSVRDDWLAHNQGAFALEVADGVVTCAATSDPADITIDVRVLAQFVTRYLRPRTAAAFGLLDVASRPALALLDRLFTGLAPFNSDVF